MTFRWLTASALAASAVGFAAARESTASSLPPAVADSLNPTERRIATAVDARNAQALALLERVVNMNSGTMNFAGVRRVGDVFRAELDALGFTTRWVDGAGFNRAGHLVAERPGVDPGVRVLLIG